MPIRRTSQKGAINPRAMLDRQLRALWVDDLRADASGYFEPLGPADRKRLAEMHAALTDSELIMLALARLLPARRHPFRRFE